MKKVVLLFTVFCMITSDASAKLITKYRYAMIFAYSQINSVYEDDNIKLEIYDEKLWATNKTTKTVFIDLAQCFLFHNGSSYPFLPTGENNKKAKEDNKKASKAGYSTKDDLFIAIAPSIGSEQKETCICNMSSRIYGIYTTTETPSHDFTDYDKRLFSMIEEILTESEITTVKISGSKNKYENTVVRHFTEDESINNIGASIAYAFNKNTEDWTNVSLSTWVSDVIFAPYYVQIPKELPKKAKRGFGVKETNPAIIHVKAESPFEFDEDKSPIIVCDWEGNYKKGTFTLAPTWISKQKGPSFLQVIAAPLTFGATLIDSYREQFYKSVTHFCGKESKWGKMVYVNDIMLTGKTAEGIQYQ